MADAASTCEFRIGAVADWQALHALLARCFAFMEGRIDPPSSLSAMTTADLEAKANSETLVTLWADGALAGCGYLRDTGEAIYLGKLAVLPEHRGRGLLRIVLAQADDMARRLGRTSLELETRIELIENHAAFAACGFRQTAFTRHAGYDRATGIVMRRDVPPA